MNLFKNKLDIKKDSLRIKFDGNLQKYVACFNDGTVVSSLNRRSVKIITKKNEELVSNPKLLEKENQLLADYDRFHKLKNLGFICNSFQALSTTRSLDVISEGMMEYLDDLTSEEDVLIGIHRTGRCNLDEISNILRYGLIITKLNESTASSDINLRNNVSYYSDNKTIVKELITADEYRQSLGSILIRIPDNELLNNIFLVDVEEERFILDPKYIIGFVPVGPNGRITEIISAHPCENTIFKGLDALYDDREYAINVDSSGVKK